MTTLVGYFDETGHSEDPRILVVGIGGAIAPLESWVRLECEWNRILSGFGIREVHMKDLAHFRGEFTGWTDERRRDLLAPLFDLMDREIAEYVAGVMVVETEWRNQSTDLRDRLRDPYYGCAITCLDACASYAAERDGRIHIVFAHQPDFSAFTPFVYDGYKQDQPNGDRLGSFVIEPLRLPQLQVGDIVAYELGHHMTDRAKGIDRRRWPLEQIKKKGIRYLKMKRRRTEEERFS